MFTDYKQVSYTVHSVFSFAFLKIGFRNFAVWLCLGNNHDVKFKKVKLLQPFTI